MNHRFISFLAAAILLAGCTPEQSGVSSNTSPVGPDTLNVADAAIAGGDPNMALSVSQSVLQTDPKSVDALIHEGDAYYALARCPAAIAAYNLALQGDPKSAAAETGLGRCLIKTDPKAAEAALVLAVQDDPGSAAALNDLGIARDLQGNFAGAVSPYQQALLAQPGMTAAEVNLGLSLALSGNGPAALQYLGPLATGQGATPKIREDYAAALVAAGRVPEARQVLSVDLTQDQVQSVLTGFSQIIAQTPPQAASPSSGDPAAAPTAPQLQTASVTYAPLKADPAPLTPAPAPSVPDIASPPPDTNPNDAYSGPSPIPGAISSSTVANAPAAQGQPAPAIRTAAKSPAMTAPAAPPATTTAPAPTGAYQVQLGALDSAPDANNVWQHIAAKMPSLFAGLDPRIEAANVKGKTYYRLRTGSFSTRGDAAKFCGQVSASGNACTIADF